MAPQQTAELRTARFCQFRDTSRKDSVANYRSIIDAVFAICYTARCALQRIKHFAVPWVGGATKFGNLPGKLSKTEKKSAVGLCQIHRMVTIYWDSN